MAIDSVEVEMVNGGWWMVDGDNLKLFIIDRELDRRSMYRKWHHLCKQHVQRRAGLSDRLFEYISGIGDYDQRLVCETKGEWWIVDRLFLEWEGSILLDKLWLATQFNWKSFSRIEST